MRSHALLKHLPLLRRPQFERSRSKEMLILWRPRKKMTNPLPCYSWSVVLSVAVIMTSLPICGNIVAVLPFPVIDGVVRSVRLAFTLPFYQWHLYSCPLFIYHGWGGSLKWWTVPTEFHCISCPQLTPEPSLSFILILA